MKNVEGGGDIAPVFPNLKHEVDLFLTYQHLSNPVQNLLAGNWHILYLEIYHRFTKEERNIRIYHTLSELMYVIRQESQIVFWIQMISDASLDPLVWLMFPSVIPNKF
jgi:hypothetical protein